MALNLNIVGAQKAKYSACSDVQQGVTGLAEPFKVEACVDTSAIDVTDANGKSLVSPDGATRVLYRFDVVTLGSPVLRVTSAEVVQ